MPSTSRTWSTVASAFPSPLMGWEDVRSCGPPRTDPFTGGRTHIARQPASWAPRTSFSALSPTITSSGAAQPALRSHSENTLRSGFAAPTSAADTWKWTTSRSASISNGFAFPSVSVPIFRPASRRESSASRAPGKSAGLFRFWNHASNTAAAASSLPVTRFSVSCLTKVKSCFRSGFSSIVRRISSLNWACSLALLSSSGQRSARAVRMALWAASRVSTVFHSVSSRSKTTHRTVPIISRACAS
mmetsp:Transcript_101396/g.302394  ORF Transcript_101396/g.302394 Transcript_101396/m.302394 type:complete len:245 (-) Transcript_101396:16-750(-)